MTGDTHDTHQTHHTRNSFHADGGMPAGGVVQSGHISTVNIATAPSSPALPTPRQLPPGPARFVNRTRELAAFHRATGPDTPDEGPFCIRVTGLWGVGRTALAQRLARLYAPRLRPDDGASELFLDLDDLSHDGACDLSEALAQLLTALGVPREWHGASHAERARQYWDATRRRPGLVLVLDNVRFGSDAAALLPASPGGLLIVVSRTRLHDLPADLPGAEIHVEPLAPAESLELLTGLLDGDDTRLATEDAAAEGLVRLCGGLPVLLRVVARSLRIHTRHSAARLLEKLREELMERGVPEMEAVWQEGYESLGEPGRRLYRALAAAPACELPEEAVVAALGEGRDSGIEALEELEDAGLVEPGHERCVRMHDTLRAHALRHAEPEETAAVRARIVRWYRRQAQQAARTARGPHLTVATLTEEVPGAPDIRLPDKTVAGKWLAAQRPALHACVRLAVGEDAWALCEALFTDHLDHPGAADTPEIFALGLLAARRAEHLPATVRMNSLLARVHWDRGDFPSAEREAASAVAAAELLPGVAPGSRAAGGGTPELHRKLYASALEFRGRAQAEQGNWAEAVPDYEASLRIHEEIGNAYGAMLLTYLLGRSSAGLGRLDEARERLSRAHAEAVRLKRARPAARSGFALAGVESGLGHHTEAERLYEASLAEARERGSTFDEARVLKALATLAETRGDDERAADLRARAALLGDQALG